MKFKQKYLIPAAIFFVIYLFGLLLFNLSRAVISAIYAYLNHLFPDTFPIYNEIYDPELYASSEKVFSVLTVFIALFIMNLIALRLDNKKYERIVQDGSEEDRPHQAIRERILRKRCYRIYRYTRNYGYPRLPYFRQAHGILRLDHTVLAWI